MLRLNRHVATTVLFSIMLVLLVMVSIDALATIVDGVGDLRADYDFTALLIHAVLTLPGSIYQNIPFSGLIGCLIGLGLLASNSELVVMRAAGLSPVRIVGFVLGPLLVLILAGAFIGEYVQPYSEQLAEARRSLLMGRQTQMASASGLWNREGSEFVHVSVMAPSGELYGVTRYRFRDGAIEEVSFAAEAAFQGDHWLERDVSITRFDDHHTATAVESTRRWESVLSPELMRLVFLEPETLPISDLLGYARYLESQSQDASRHWLAFWNKALQPLTIASLVLVAVSFIFGPLRQSTMGFRIFAGVIVGIVFSTSQQLLGPASLLYGFSPLWAVLAPIALSVLAGLVLLRRAG